jgi:hypothetical protein
MKAMRDDKACAMIRLMSPLTATLVLAAATLAVLPPAKQSIALLGAQNDPARLADIAVDEVMSAPVAKHEIDEALAAGDPELAASFVELAADRGIAVDPAVAARVEAANGTGVKAAHAALSFTQGLVTGAPDDLAGIAGTATGDLFVFGDIRDAVREGIHIARGEPADELILGLACAGIAITAGTYATIGAGAPARLGLSLLKAARKTGRLAAPMAEWMTRALRQTVDTRAFGAALGKASITAPLEAVRLARDAVKVDRAEGVVAMVRDVGRVEAAAGTRAALEGLKIAEEPEDVARLARLAETKGGKTRAILKLAGRAAIVLTAAAMDLASWVFALLLGAFGFCKAVKRTSERATWSYLRWRKARRARRQLPALA